MEKNGIRICSNTMLKNKGKIDEKPKCKIGGYKIPRVKHRCLCTHTCVCVCVCVCVLSHVQLFVAPGLLAYQAPVYMEFSR